MEVVGIHPGWQTGTTLENERVCSFSRVVGLLWEVVRVTEPRKRNYMPRKRTRMPRKRMHMPRKRMHMFVFEGSGRW